MTEERCIKRNAYMRERMRRLRREDREHVVQREKKWRDANPERVAAWKRRDSKKHAERYKSKAREWYVAHPEQAKQSRRLYYEKNRAAAIARAREWEKEHPENKRARTQNRRARLVSSVGKHTAADVAELYGIQNKRCAGCRKPLLQNYEVDHVIPLSKGGGNGPDNLQLLCPGCNRAKGSMHPDAWAARLGKLFV